MTAYIIRRLLYLIPVVLGVLLVTFCLFTLVGGDISQQIAHLSADCGQECRRGNDCGSSP
jgi:ABC-type microcin C transport system permease subunit YejB